MKTLLFTHVAAIAIWAATVLAEIHMEGSLWRAREAPRQKVLLERLRAVAILLEAPVVLFALTTGLILMWKTGYFTSTKAWPSWFELKINCVAMLLVVHALHIGFVLMRSYAADDLLGQIPPLANFRVSKWHYAVALTAVSVPFSAITFWLTLAHPV